LWAESESALSRHLREHPEVERALLESSLEELIATHVFFRGDDEANLSAAREAGTDGLATRRSALAAFSEAGWSVSVELEQDVRAEPTPMSALVPGVGIDGLPVVATSGT
jgi:hypothetical protein